MSRMYFVLLLVLLLVLLIEGNENILKKRENIVAQCEYDALKVGSDIADLFNKPIGDENLEDRIHQENIIEHLGFAPWIASNDNEKLLQTKNKWINSKIEDSPYNVLNKKWIYMFGDSTLRQIWASFAAPFQDNHFERNSKEWTRQYCNKQEHRTHHLHGNNFHENDGWGGPCGKNEVTCHVAGYGEGGLLTLDWKHFPYEDYDEWLWGNSGPWINGFSGENRLPNVLVVQLGLHSCWHAHPDGLYSKHLQSINSSMINKHLKDIPILMEAIRHAIYYSKSNNSNPIVIFSTSGSTGVENSALMDECILKFNRAVSDYAHAYGFFVLERGEIERRIIYKSIQNDVPYIKLDMHLPQPVQNIIATCLLKLIDCLDKNKSIITDNNLVLNYYLNSTIVNNMLQLRKKPTYNSRPLHVPPPPQ